MDHLVEWCRIHYCITFSQVESDSIFRYRSTRSCAVREGFEWDFAIPSTMGSRPYEKRLKSSERGWDPHMKKLVAAENATLDGMVAEPDGGMNFMKYLDEDMAR